MHLVNGATLDRWTALSDEDVVSPAATVAGLVALLFGALAIANRVSPFE